MGSCTPLLPCWALGLGLLPWRAVIGELRWWWTWKEYIGKTERMEKILCGTIFFLQVKADFQKSVSAKISILHTRSVYIHHAQRKWTLPQCYHSCGKAPSASSFQPYVKRSRVVVMKFQMFVGSRLKKERIYLISQGIKWGQIVRYAMQHCNAAAIHWLTCGS